jgi:ABC-2 type transport system permease protein
MCAVGMVVMGVFGLLFLPLKWLDVLAVIVCVSVATHLINTLDLYINIARPFVNWTHPTAAVKNNMNILFALVMRLVLGVVLYYFVKIVPFDSFVLKALVLTGVLTLIYVLQRQFLYPKFLEKFKTMEW